VVGESTEEHFRVDRLFSLNTLPILPDISVVLIPEFTLFLGLLQELPPLLLHPIHPHYTVLFSIADTGGRLLG
jgi:hypothetical protein